MEKYIFTRYKKGEMIVLNEMIDWCLFEIDSILININKS